MSERFDRRSGGASRLRIHACAELPHRKLPLLSTGGALQEVAGLGAIYAAPYNIDAMAGAMRNLANMSDNERRDRLARLNDSVARLSP